MVNTRCPINVVSYLTPGPETAVVCSVCWSIGIQPTTQVDSAFYPPGGDKSSTCLPGCRGLRQCAFTCVWWHVTLCKCVILYGRWRSVVLISKELYTPLTTEDKLGGMFPIAVLLAYFSEGRRQVILRDCDVLCHRPLSVWRTVLTRFTDQACRGYGYPWTQPWIYPRILCWHTW